MLDGRRRVTERDLTISGDLMFSTVFQDRELCRELVETLLSTHIESVEVVVPQRRMKVAPLSRAGVVDVLARDSRGRVFDIEMQNSLGKGLPRRVRYYGSLIDVSIFEVGEDFDGLPDQVVIFICSDDPFDEGLKRYTCRTTCQESDRTIDDGQTSVYVNARGFKGASTPALDAFLAYVKDGSTIEANEFVHRVDASVKATRDDPAWRRDLMLWSLKYHDDFAEAHRQGRAEGRKEGRDEGRAEGREEGRDEGRSDIARLADALSAAGRSDELVPALQDPARLDGLLREFGIGQVEESSAPAEESAAPTEGAAFPAR